MFEQLTLRYILMFHFPELVREVNKKYTVNVYILYRLKLSRMSGQFFYRHELAFAYMHSDDFYAHKRNMFSIFCSLAALALHFKTNFI